MADQIIETGLRDVDEVWGQEVSMYMPGFYAGMTDLVGVHSGAQAIINHKSAKKMRSKDMNKDCFCQMAAYALAYNEVYNTRSCQGVIFMVDRELKYQNLIIEGNEFDQDTTVFLNRYEGYLAKQAIAA